MWINKSITSDTLSFYTKVKIFCYNSATLPAATLLMKELPMENTKTIIAKIATANELFAKLTTDEQETLIA